MGIFDRKGRALDKYLDAATSLALLLERLEERGGSGEPADPEYGAFKEEAGRAMKAAAKAGVRFGWLPDSTVEAMERMGHPEAPELLRDFATFIAGVQDAFEEVAPEAPEPGLVVRAEIVYEDGPAVIDRLRQRRYLPEQLDPLGDLRSGCPGVFSLQGGSEFDFGVFESADGVPLPVIDRDDGTIGMSSVLTGRAGGFYGGESLRLELRLLEPVSATDLERIEQDDWTVVPLGGAGG